MIERRNPLFDVTYVTSTANKFSDKTLKANRLGLSWIDKENRSSPTVRRRFESTNSRLIMTEGAINDDPFILLARNLCGHLLVPFSVESQMGNNFETQLEASSNLEVLESHRVAGLFNVHCHDRETLGTNGENRSHERTASCN